MKISSNSKTFSYGYIQPTFFDNVIDVVCFWKLKDRKRLERKLITCKNIKAAIKALQRIES